MKSSQLEDQHVIKGMIRKDPPITNYFFRCMCDNLLRDIQFRIFKGNIEIDELIDELYLYLSYQDWYRLRQFNYQSKLTTWVDRVAHRFFLKQQLALSNIPSPLTSDLSSDREDAHFILSLEEKMDVEATLEYMSNPRYREVIRLLYLEDMDPEEVAKTMGVSMANFYNLKRRACVMFQVTYKKMAEPLTPFSQNLADEAVPSMLEGYASMDSQREYMDTKPDIKQSAQHHKERGILGFCKSTKTSEVYSEENFDDSFDNICNEGWSALECLNYDGDIPILLATDNNL